MGVKGKLKKMDQSRSRKSEKKNKAQQYEDKQKYEVPEGSTLAEQAKLLAAKFEDTPNEKLLDYSHRFNGHPQSFKIAMAVWCKRRKNQVKIELRNKRVETKIKHPAWVSKIQIHADANWIHGHSAAEIKGMIKIEQVKKEKQGSYISDDALKMCLESAEAMPMDAFDE